MTDNEIKEALECCQTDHCHGSKCPLFNGTVNTKDCITKLSAESLDLINRQQARIKELEEKNTVQSKIINERAEAIIQHDSVIRELHKEIERLQKENNQFADIGKMYSEIKAEAIKEFAERFEANFEISSAYSFGYIACQIDNLVKEMVGDADV